MDELKPVAQKLRGFSVVIVWCNANNTDLFIIEIITFLKKFFQHVCF